MCECGDNSANNTITQRSLLVGRSVGPGTPPRPNPDFAHRSSIPGDINGPANTAYSGRRYDTGQNMNMYERVLIVGSVYEPCIVLTRHDVHHRICAV